jgi:hypothetical protein
MIDVDDKFFERADKHINVSNKQLEDATMGQVGASMMYSSTRFNAWVSACGWQNREDMEGAEQRTIKYFVDEYKRMLTENLEDYIINFERYMETSKRD